MKIKAYLALATVLTIGLGLPAHAVSEGSCIRQQGRSFNSVQSSLGPGKLISSTAATQYVPAMRVYKYGSYRAGTCMVIFQNGAVASATYSKF